MKPFAKKALALLGIFFIVLPLLPSTGCQKEEITDPSYSKAKDWKKKSPNAGKGGGEL